MIYQAYKLNFIILKEKRKLSMTSSSNRKSI